MEIKGIVASEGKVEGKVKLVTSMKDVGKVTNENIVVTNNNSPLFSLAFIKGKGIISERGGMLSHLAIVAREMKKPCLLGVKKATEILKDGMEIVLDCNKGKIIIKNEK